MKAFKLMCFDVDGCLTTGQVLVSPIGESFIFNIQDGLGVKMLAEIGIEVIAISGRDDPSVKKRLSALGFKAYHGGVSSKLPLLKTIIKSMNISMAEVVFMGDDLIDIPCMLEAGLSIGPANCVPEVFKIANYVTAKNGGEGAAREAIDIVFKLMGESMEDIFFDAMLDCTAT